MTYIKYFTTIILIFVSSICCLGQCCVGQSVYIHNQTKMNNFYPNTEVLDNLTISGITYLDNLSNLTTLDGYFFIGNGGTGVTNLNALPNLTSIGGNFSIYNNAYLTSLDGLSNLTTIGGNLDFNGNASLTNTDGLSNLTTIGGDFGFSENDILTNIDGLSSLTTIAGDVWIQNNPNLTSINLPNLTSIGGAVIIRNNPNLTSINLPNLTSIGGHFRIYENTSLIGLDDLSSLIFTSGDLEIRDNPALTNIDGLTGLTSVATVFNIENNASLINLDGLSGLTSVGEDLTIRQNASLTNLDGLSGLASIGRHFSVAFNDALTDCCGIQNLLNTPEAIVGWSGISDNPSECSSKNEVKNIICEPTCTDGILNGGEISLDCGGSYCPCGDAYVDGTAMGNNTGTSWGNAFTDLQDALRLGSGNTIHIAEGLYKPTSTTIRGKSFEIPSNTTLLGGYPNGGGNRNPENNFSMLSGEIDNIMGYDGNSYHVVKIKDAIDVIIDGVHIKDGYADDISSFARSRGGGVYSSGSTFTIRNSIIRRNRALYGAGIFATLSPEVMIEDSEIKLNQANYGSAIYHSNATNMHITRTRIIDNNSLIRCAIEINNSLYTKIENSIIANNTSINANAIGFIATNRNQSADILNSTIVGESKNKYLLTFQTGNNNQLDISMSNTILSHKDSQFDKNLKAYGSGIFNFTHNNCYFQGGTVIGMGNNILLSEIDGNLTFNSDYSLDECSPTVDSGDNTLVFSSSDINGNARIVNVVDLGAYESQVACISPRNRGSQEESPLVIAPNPTNGKFTVHSNGNYIFELYDLQGRSIFETSSNVIDITKQPAGIYILKSTNQDNEVSYFNRIVKN